MAAVSNYSQHSCGPQWLMYSRALGGAVRKRTPSLLLCSLTMLDGSGFKNLNTPPQIILWGYVIVHFSPTKPLPWFLMSPVRCRCYAAEDMIAKVSQKCNCYMALHPKERRSLKFVLFLYVRALSEREVIIDLLLVLKCEPSNICVYHLTRPLCCWLPVCCSVWRSGKWSFLIWAAVDNNLSSGRIQTLPLMSALFGGEGQ